MTVFRFLTFLLLGSLGAPLAADTWPHWRGPSMDGISSERALPTTWSATENVAWRLPLPAFSGSTPIIWNDTIFLNVATERAHGADRALGRRPQQTGGRLEASALGREPDRQQAEHVVALARDRRQARLGDHRHRHTERLRLRRHGTVDAGHPEGLRQVRRSSSATRRRRCCTGTRCISRCCTVFTPTIRPTS